jgi:hypothetical protein
MHTSFKFRCQHCDTGLVADRKSAGLPCNCPSCAARLMVPLPVTSTALVRIDQGDIYQGDDDDVCDPDFSIGDIGEVAEIVPRGSRALSQARGAPTPVELRMPGNLGSLKASVDQPTSNAMATTFLGGLLVAVGAVLFAMFGGKHKA